jgi:hypothetical protein
MAQVMLAAYALRVDLAAAPLLQLAGTATAMQRTIVQSVQKAEKTAASR